MNNASQHGRRHFLKSALRFLVLAALGIGTGSLIVRRGEQCVNNGICRGCAAFTNCGLPQALSAKQALSTGASWNTSQNK